MKLRCENVSLLENRHERSTVIAVRDARFTCIERHVGMGEIKICVQRNAFEELARPNTPQLVPSHVGEAIVRRKSRNLLGKEGQPYVSWRFVARGEHRLQAETNAQQWSPARDGLLQRLYERTLTERTHESSKMADSGQNECVAGGERIR
jgi:hypothetical protein